MASKVKAQGPEESSGSQKKAAVQLLGPSSWVGRLHSTEVLLIESW